MKRVSGVNFPPGTPQWCFVLMRDKHQDKLGPSESGVSTSVFRKEPTINISGFASHTVFVETTGLGHCSMKTGQRQYVST